MGKLRDEFVGVECCLPSRIFGHPEPTDDVHVPLALKKADVRGAQPQSRLTLPRTSRSAPELPLAASSYRVNAFWSCVAPCSQQNLALPRPHLRDKRIGAHARVLLALQPSGHHGHLRRAADKVGDAGKQGSCCALTPA